MTAPKARGLRPAMRWPLLLIWILVGCGGGGGGGGTPTTPTPPPAPSGITWTSAGAANPSSITLRRQVGNTGSTLVLEVVATSVQDLYGVAFDVLYPANLLSFQGATEGSFLNDGGEQTSFQAAGTGGTLILGVTRLGNAPGTSGSGVLMTLRFSAAGNGGSTVRFDNNFGIDPEGARLAGLEWAGGSVTVQ